MTAAAGGVLGAVIITGIRRAAFSNEAGIGTESMAHGAARTREPVREGLVAMVSTLKGGGGGDGPFPNKESH